MHNFLVIASAMKRLFRFLRNFIRGLVLLALAALVVFFVRANSQAVIVSLDPLPYEAELPLYAFAFAILCFGVLVTYFFLLRDRMKHAWRERRQLHRIHALENENEALRVQHGALAVQHGTTTATQPLTPLS